MSKSDLEGFGAELRELEFDGFWDWFVHVGDFSHFWKAQPTYVIAQVVFLLGGLCTFIHAMRSGGRLRYLWLGTVMHGMVVEMAAYWLPDIDNFWHSQLPIMFLGRRLPLHIIFLYPCFLYNASVAISKLRLPSWAEPFAVGLTVVLIDIPYDIVSVKFVHWTWHDTDPNIFDRHYWVPWNSYYFHSCFAASFTFWFHGFRRWFGATQGAQDKWCSKEVGKEIACTVMAALLGMPGGVLLFLPIYHPLHDVYRIHSEVTFFILFSVFLAIAWSGDRYSHRHSLTLGQKKCALGNSWILLTHLVIHYSAFLAMCIFYDPKDEVSIGMHERTGPCNIFDDVHTAFGMTLQKRRFLCLNNYNEAYFDFKCLPKPPGPNMSWYTICGTPFENRAEYIAVIGAICFLAFNVFSNLHFLSAGEVDTTSARASSQKKGTITKAATKKKKQL